MKMAKFFSLLIAAGFVFGFNGCKVKDGANGKNLVIWHWMSDREEVFKELALQYEKETGIKVDFELYAPSEAYSQKVRAAAQTNTLPDMFGILGDTRDFASFVKSGFVHKLDAEMDADNSAWRNTFFSRSLISNIFTEANQYGVDPGIYGVPIDVANIQMVYNKKLFTQAGLDPNKPPKDWDEFLKQIDKLNESKISGFVCGWGEVWLIECFASNYAFNIMGEQKLMDTFEGKVSYTDPDWIKVFGLFKQMKDKNALVPGTITMVNKTAEQNFALERAAFSFNGSWCVNVYKGMNPALEYGSLMPPPASNKFPMRIWGWGGSSFVINATSDKKDVAVAFLKWLTSKDIQILLAEKTKNLPSNKDSLGNLDPILSEFAASMDYSTHPSNWRVREDARVMEVFNKGIQSIITGEKTPKEIAEAVQKAKQDIIKKAAQ